MPEAPHWGFYYAACGDIVKLHDYLCHPNAPNETEGEALVNNQLDSVPFCNFALPASCAACCLSTVSHRQSMSSLNAHRLIIHTALSLNLRPVLNVSISPDGVTV